MEVNAFFVFLSQKHVMRSIRLSVNTVEVASVCNCFNAKITRSSKIVEIK